MEEENRKQEEEEDVIRTTTQSYAAMEQLYSWAKGIVSFQ